MNKLPKEKRDQLILVCMCTLVALAVIGLGLIRRQYAGISAINARNEAARNNLQSMEDAIKRADTISAQVVDLTYTLSHTEGDLATGDPAAWIYDTIRNFKAHYKVDIRSMASY